MGLIERRTDPGEAIPAFLTMLLMPLTFSITDRIAWGFVSDSLLSVVTARRTPVLVHVFAVLFVLRYVFLPCSKRRSNRPRSNRCP